MPHSHRESIGQMGVDGFAVGYHESLEWLLNGCLELAQTLQEQQVSHVSHFHQGTHTSHTYEVFVDVVLPLFHQHFGKSSD